MGVGKGLPFPKGALPPFLGAQFSLTENWATRLDCVRARVKIAVAIYVRVCAPAGDFQLEIGSERGRLGWDRDWRDLCEDP